MYVQGVGHGSQKCEWSVRMPISVPSIVDGVETVAPHFFEAPIVAEQGAHLPALLGLKSLREKAAVLVLSPDDDELQINRARTRRHKHRSKPWLDSVSADGGRNRASASGVRPF